MTEAARAHAASRAAAVVRLGDVWQRASTASGAAGVADDGERLVRRRTEAADADVVPAYGRTLHVAEGWELADSDAHEFRDWRLLITENTDLDVVGPGVSLQGVVLEGLKAMVSVDATEAGVLAEFVLPPAAVEAAKRDGVCMGDWSPGELPLGRMIPQKVQRVADAGATRAPCVEAPVVTAEAAAEALRQRGVSRIVVLTGAGVSSASGLRTRKELWSTLDREDHVGVWRTQEDGWRGLWGVTESFLADAGADMRPKPNAAHTALASLEAAGLLTSVITQNIDGLHQAAGSRTVLELHGTLDATHCDTCGASGPSCRDVLHGRRHVAAEPNSDGNCKPVACPAPGCGGLLRPSVVLFGELVQASVLQAALEQVRQADAIIVAGTAADGALTCPSIHRACCLCVWARSCACACACDVHEYAHVARTVQILYCPVHARARVCAHPFSAVQVVQSNACNRTCSHTRLALNACTAHAPPPHVAWKCGFWVQWLPR